MLSHKIRIESALIWLIESIDNMECLDQPDLKMSVLDVPFDETSRTNVATHFLAIVTPHAFEFFDTACRLDQRRVVVPSHAVVHFSSSGLTQHSPALLGLNILR